MNNTGTDKAIPLDSTTIPARAELQGAVNEALAPLLGLIKSLGPTTLRDKRRVFRAAVRALLLALVDEGESFPALLCPQVAMDIFHGLGESKVMNSEGVRVDPLAPSLPLNDPNAN